MLPTLEKGTELLVQQKESGTSVHRAVGSLPSCRQMQMLSIVGEQKWVLIRKTSAPPAYHGDTEAVWGRSVLLAS